MSVHEKSNNSESQKVREKSIKSSKLTIAPLPVITGDEMKEIRIHLEMSRRVFAKALGVSNKTVQVWEEGKNTPSGTTIRIYEFLKKDIKFLEKHIIIKK